MKTLSHRIILTVLFYLEILNTIYCSFIKINGIDQQYIISRVWISMQSAFFVGGGFSKKNAFRVHNLIHVMET